MGTLRYHWQQAEHRSARRLHIQSIILHSTEGHKDGDIATLVHGDGRCVSVHWYVTKTGEIYHFVQDADAANHAGEVIASKYSNDASIGIEQEHIDGKEPWPDVQIQTVANLVAFLLQKHGPLEIASHAKAAPGRKHDPEPYPWDTFNAMLKKARRDTWGVVQL